MNTRFEYSYVDASNYKQHGFPVLAGEMTPAQFAAIGAKCSSGEFFLAHQVGLPELQERMWDEHSRSDDDHIWHTLTGFTLVNAPADPGLPSVDELVAAFERVDAWDESEAMRRLGFSAGPFGF